MDERDVLARDGAKRAAEHADRVSEDWCEVALRWVRHLAIHRKQMSSEHARTHAFVNGCPEPPDARSWGHIMPMAARRGYIKKAKDEHGRDVWTKGVNTQAHGRHVRVWDSLLYVEPTWPR